MQHIEHFGPLAAGYEGFIIDLWGVIHDGVTPYEGAVECLARLHELGKKVVLLSNAPRRAHVAREAMRDMGIPDHLTAGILTSGEVVHRMLRDRTDPWFAGLGDRAFHIGQTRDLNVIETLPITLAAAPRAASFVLNTGAHEAASLTDPSAYDAVLRQCRDAGLPMICANPDLEVIREGRRWICAGALAQNYEAIGGEVRWIGKPDPAVYAPVIAMLGVPAPGILAIGDALRTDMAGAAAVGIAGCWVLGGIHAEELGADPDLVERAAAAAQLAPVAAIPAFVW
jgi:HAD superfamily hydrolase (TIGR01459 family)